MTDDRSALGTGVTGPILPLAPSASELLALATEPHPAAPAWTRAGRALQKHGYRPTGSVYPRVAGPPAHYNAVARQIVETILNDPRSVVKGREHRWFGQLVPFIDVRAADGRTLGYLWDPQSSRFRFHSFREP